MAWKQSLSYFSKGILGFFVTVLVLALGITVYVTNRIRHEVPTQLHLRTLFEHYDKDVVLNDKARNASKTDTKCLFHTCLSVYDCGYNDRSKISVYIYPVRRWVDSKQVPITLPHSKEFRQVIEAIVDSEYYTSSPERACLFIPSVDMLNQNNIRLQESGQVLSSLQ